MGSIIGSPLPPNNPPPPPQYQQPAYPPPPAYPPQAYTPPQETGGWKIGALFVAVLAALGACGYLFYQISQLRAQIAETRDSVMQEIAKTQEASSVSAQTSRRNAEILKQELAEARRQASQLAGQAKVDATKHADELAAKLEQVQAQQAQRVTAVAADVSQVKDQASATQTRVGEVSGTVDSLKTEQAATKQQLEKTIADLKSTIGDLGVQSGLIATNSKELAALRQLGERNYTEFKLAKQKQPTKIGDVMVRLTSADTKRNRYTIELIADDKKVEKKDKSINEPVQFYLSRAAQPYELVVNEIRKDMIVGYVAAPKVQQARKAAAN